MQEEKAKVSQNDHVQTNKKLAEDLKRSEKVKKMLLLTRQLRFITFSEMKILRVLGHGSNGIVFLVEIQLRKETVQLALKMIMNFHHITTSKLENHFVNEFDVLFKLVDIHPNIIHILADFSAPPSLEMIRAVDESSRPLLMKVDKFGREVPITTQFFLIDYHPVTLKQRLKERKASAEEIYTFAGELIDCFLFLFENRVVHRDVKLDNVLVSVDGSLILSDFGESLEMDENCCCSYNNLRAGNLRFTAPEVLNQIGSGKAKINFAKQHSWDVGCLLFRIIFGHFPFPKYPMVYGRAPNIAVPELCFPPCAPVDDGLLEIISKLLVNNVEFRISIKEAHSQFEIFEKGSKNC